MILFWSLSVLMVLAAIALVVRPLMSNNVQVADVGVTGHSRRSAVLMGCALLVVSLGMYLYTGHWQWSEESSLPTTQETVSNIDTPEIKKLIEQIKSQPANATLLIELGGAYVAAEAFMQGAEAYQKAYELTQGKDLNAITGWVEALVLSDPNSVNGQAASLVEEALALNPKHPRALWYGGLIALQMQNPKIARDRFSAMLSLNPPDAIRQLLERQLQELDGQLSNDVQPSSNASAAKNTSPNAREISVSVKVSPELQAQIKQPMTLFILARHPTQSGPPLAVERHQSGELPINVELTSEDAMLPTRTISDADEVQVVARLSTAGVPTEQSGDLFGVAQYSFTKQGQQGTVSIEINQRVP